MKLKGKGRCWVEKKLMWILLGIAEKILLDLLHALRSKSNLKGKELQRMKDMEVIVQRIEAFRVTYL